MRIRPYLRCAGRFGLLPLICLALRAADAGSATWNLNPGSSDWNDPLNWTPNTIPNSEDAVATFGVSNVTGVRVSRPGDTVDRIIFTSTASAYTLATENNPPKTLCLPSAGSALLMTPA